MINVYANIEIRHHDVTANSFTLPELDARHEEGQSPVDYLDHTRKTRRATTDPLKETV